MDSILFRLVLFWKVCLSWSLGATKLQLHCLIPSGHHVLRILPRIDDIAINRHD